MFRLFTFKPLPQQWVGSRGPFVRKSLLSCCNIKVLNDHHRHCDFKRCRWWWWQWWTQHKKSRGWWPFVRKSLLHCCCDIKVLNDDERHHWIQMTMMWMIMLDTVKRAGVGVCLKVDTSNVSILTYIQLSKCRSLYNACTLQLSPLRIQQGVNVGATLKYSNTDI